MKTNPKLTVQHKHYTAYLNPSMLSNQNAWDNLDRIRSLQILKFTAFVAIENTDDPTELAAILEFLTEVEFDLQSAWNFPRNANFHRFWTYPKCSCPKLDNEDRFGTKWSINDPDCPLHGVTDDLQ